jgi:hypothetical protein
MQRAVAFLRFWYDFVIGDDWRIAVGVVVALALTYTLAHRGVTTWFILPAVVAAGLTLSIWRAAR